MNELKVIKNTGVIETNFKEFMAELKKSSKQYKGLVVTEDNLKDMKQTRLGLTKSKKAIDDKRKEVKKAYQEPLKVYEGQCKEAIAVVVEVEEELKASIDVFDERVRLEKLDHALTTAQNLAEIEGLTDEYFNRIITDKDEYTNVTMTKTKIGKDIDEQVKELKKIQVTKENNEKYVVSQLVTASKLAGLSTDLVMDDISHLISDYETMDVIEITEAITAVAIRRKEAEELAIKQAEERIRQEEQRKAEAKEREARERILAEERAKERAEREELDRLRKLEADRLEAIRQAELKEELSKAIIEEAEKTNEAIIESFVEVEHLIPEFEPVEEFVNIEEAQESEALTVIRISCKQSETIDVLRLLAINGYECEVE